MYKMLIYISSSVYKQERGRMLPLSMVDNKKVGYVEGDTIEECAEKFNKMIPKGFVEMKSGNK